MGPTKELRIPVQLQFGILTTLLLLLCSLNAELNIEKTTSTINAFLGNNVTLPCVLTHDNNQQLDLNLSIVGIRWKKISSDGNEIDVYRFLNLKHEQDRPGSAIDERELRRGNASLTLYHVQRGDEGEYTCTMFVTPNKAWTKMIVTVLAQPDVTLSAIELTVELGSEKSVICEVTKFYPEVVKVRWVKFSKSSGKSSSLNKGTCLSVSEENSDGSFNVTSLLTVRPSSLEETGDSYSCYVTHESSNQDQEVRFTLTVTEPPTSKNLVIIIAAVFMILLLVSVIALSYVCFRKTPPTISEIAGTDDLVHEKSSSLSWMVSNFKPKNFEMDVYLDRGVGGRKSIPWKIIQTQNSDEVDNPGGGEQIRLLEQQNVPQPPTSKRSLFSYSYLCSANITPDKKKDKGSKLVIKVKHVALKSPLIKTLNLTIKGDIFTAHIIAPQCLKHGEEVTLTCDINKCDPGSLSITWLKGKQVIYIDGKIEDTRYTHTETRDVPHEGNVLKSSSSLTFTAKVKEDHGVKYTCKVAYSKIEKVFKPRHETFVTAQPVVEQITSEHEGRQMKLSCRVHSFHPRTIEIKWFKQYEELPTTDCELDMDEDDLYSTTSILMYIPKIEDIGKTFKCQVDHQSLPIPEVREWKLEEQRMIGTTS